MTGRSPLTRPSAPSRRRGEKGRGLAEIDRLGQVPIETRLRGAVAILDLAIAGQRDEVLGAGSGREGLELASAHRPAYVIVDIGLPDESGHVVGRRLRELGSDVMLVAFSGYGQPEDRQRSREAGFDAHVVKPVAPQALMALLAEHGRRHASAAGRAHPVAG